MNEDELLSRELAKLGGMGGAFGGAVSGGAAGGLGGEWGGSAGAAVASKFLPTEYYQTNVELDVDPPALLKSAYSFFEANGGEVLGEGDDSESRYPKVSGVVGSGFFNMNPTVLHVEIVDAEEEKCSVLLTGHAKEGLIKQRSAEKAVGRMADFLPAAAQ